MMNKSEELLLAKRKYQKTLLKCKVNGISSTKRNLYKCSTDIVYSSDIYKSLQDTFSVCPKKKPENLDVDIVIGQAYNKGGLQVLTTSETRDSFTGKRRT